MTPEQEKQARTAYALGFTSQVLLEKRATAPDKAEALLERSLGWMQKRAAKLVTKRTVILAQLQPHLPPA
jgi:hypothetical protein